VRLLEREHLQRQEAEEKGRREKEEAERLRRIEEVGAEREAARLAALAARDEAVMAASLVEMAGEEAGMQAWVAANEDVLSAEQRARVERREAKEQADSAFDGHLEKARLKFEAKKKAEAEDAARLAEEARQAQEAAAVRARVRACVRACERASLRVGVALPGSRRPRAVRVQCT
jgi:hypothetical protein